MEDDIKGNQPNKPSSAVGEPPPTDKTDINAALPLLQLIGADKFTFSPTATQAFLKKVFPPDLIGQDEHVLTFSTAKPSLGIGYPHQQNNQLNQILTRTTKPQALYFNTATHYATESGLLRHQKAYFGAMYVLVLDDIGTKIKDLPEALDDPSYIIETSKGNFQYGYLLDEPIKSYQVASGLIQTASAAGLTDSGGLMPNKIVRLPDGVNGKKDPEKGKFPVTLIKDDGPIWETDELIKAMNCTVNGELITLEGIKNGTAPLKKKYHTTFRQKQPEFIATDGTIDPVVEWLSENNMLLGEGETWLMIECPWSNVHTSGTTASYSPLGQGDMPNRRGFKCMHDHCKERDTDSFLRYVIANSSFQYLAAREDHTVPTHAYAFQETDATVWMVKGPHSLTMQGFRGMFNQLIYPISPNGKKERMTVASYWMHNPYRLNVLNAVSIPGQPRIFNHKGNNVLNQYEPSPWSDGPYDQTEVDKFIDYVEYLLPSDDERDYFLDWLSAKLIDPKFRGTAIMMVAQTQGIGRTTLANMIGQLLGSHNCMDVPFNELIAGEKFNEWADKLFVSVSEAQDNTQGAMNGYKAYEALKLQIDTTPREVTVNKKYARTFQALTCTSTLILTNHPDAIRPPVGDRRLTVMTNALVPRSPAWFTYTFLPWQQKGDWAEHIYRWLRTRSPDMKKLSLPLRTAGRQKMITLGENQMEKQLRICLEGAMAQGLHFITAADIEKTVLSVDTKTQTFKHALRKLTIGFKDLKIKMNKESKRPRLIASMVATTEGFIEGCPDWPAMQIPTVLKDRAKKDLTDIDLTALGTYLINNQPDVE